jgi:glycosyltransferase involved in cell wall biosynthesis
MKVLFVSSMAFDACLSLIKRLQTKSDLYYIFELKPYKPNRIGLNRKFDEDVLLASELEEMDEFKYYLPLQKTYMINGCSLKNFIPLIRKQIKTYRLIKQINPDIIHCFNELPPVFFLFLILNRKKIVLTVHDPIQHSGENTWIKWLMRKISFLTVKKHILLNNIQYDEYILKYKKKREDIFLSSLGIYEFLSDYIQPNNNSTRSSVFNVLFFGRISPYKGIDYLLEAFVMLQNTGIKNIHLTIAGAGNFSFDITKYKSNKQITFLNRFISNKELANLIDKSSVVVCPYIDATQSGVIMSAFALNKPVIATRVGGLVEMVKDRKTGILVSPKNSYALKYAIMELYQNPELLLSMSQTIYTEYKIGPNSWETITDGLLDIYEDVLHS